MRQGKAKGKEIPVRAGFYGALDNARKPVAFRKEAPPDGGQRQAGVPTDAPYRARDRKAEKALAVRL
jgi:hypothetical protein